METIKETPFAEINYDRRSIGNNGFISFTKLFCIDCFLLNISFFICNYFKRGTFELAEPYTRLLFMFYLCWFFTSLMGNKFKPISYIAYGTGMFTFLKSSLYLAYSIIFLVVVLGFSEYSRIQIFSTCFTLFVLNCLAWSVYNKAFNSRETDRISLKNVLEPLRFKNGISYPLVCMDLALVMFSFFIVNYFKRGHVELLPDYPKLFMIILGLWFVVSVMTRKFSVGRFSSIYFLTWQWLKSGGLMLATMSVLIFGMRLFNYSRIQALGSILLLMVMEFALVVLYFRISKGKALEQDIESANKVKNILKQNDIPMDIDVDVIRQKLMTPARKIFKRTLGSDNPDLFDFMDQHIALDDMMRMETSIERSSEWTDLNSDRVPTRLFLNQNKVNDVRRVNAYFLKVHQMLLPGGYFIGHAHTINTHYKWMYKKFPRYFANALYVADFCFNRIMPKLPGLQKIYFSITKGKGRVLSRAEFLGRLCFCGFDIVAEKEIDQRLYVIARKAKTSSLDTSPTYGPLIQLKRSGWGGATTFLYKFRTMHPYSEYLQQYVYDLQGLQKGGKIENDFRMTTWGKFMRKLWLDELPMLYNWLKGDLSLVGVRPLSFHYLGLYDKDLQELRKKVKPGLVPPFYVDLPTTFEEICDSERRYINRFLKNPVRTQCVYFWKSFVNIAIKGARSN
jgi:hypothetical protein